MKKIILILIFVASGMYAKTLDQKIGNMFVLGFYGTKVSSSSGVVRDVCRGGLGGVLLFDRHPSRHSRAKNISSPKQLKALTRFLKSACGHQPLIAVDQEGGKVQRLRNKNGFYGKYPGASTVAKKGKRYAKSIYAKMARELHQAGINFNLAPVADMAVNRKNRVIYKLGRSYGADPKSVAKYDKIFIDAMHRAGVLTSLKHFPGHGSSLGDTHRGFVDVSSSWSSRELEPFEYLVDMGMVDSVMVAHVFNRHLDSRYPASLSRSTIHGKLRVQMGYDGVVITDDLQMYAISKHYSLEQTIALAINAGVDIMLFGNQLDPKHEVTLSRLVAITKKLLRNGKISRQSIENANRRIDKMKQKIGLRP